MNLEDRLYEHCLGKVDPSGFLLSTGALPEGWVDTYFRLLDQAKSRWSKYASAPRSAVAAIHFASMYLPIRYSMWEKFSGEVNSKTHDDLARLRCYSEVWLLAFA